MEETLARTKEENKSFASLKETHYGGRLIKIFF